MNCCQQQRMGSNQPHGVIALWLLGHALHSEKAKKIEKNYSLSSFFLQSSFKLHYLAHIHLCACVFLPRSMNASFTMALLWTETFVHFLVKSLRLPCSTWRISKIGRWLDDIHVAIVLYQNAIVFTHCRNNFDLFATVVTVNLWIRCENTKFGHE